jgi:predicted RNA-binding protein with PUA-like domain
MAHWIFKASPLKYKIDERLSEPLVLVTWKVNNEYRNDVAVGDIAFIYRTGPRRGIVGALRVTVEPCLMEEIDSEKRFCMDLALGMEWRVRGEITHRCASAVILAEELRDTAGLENLSVFHGFNQRTTFPVRPDEAEILTQLLESRCGSA